LSCFSKPDKNIIAKVGYKRAAGCLLGKSCHACGKMAANANPLLFTRVCKPCAVADEASFPINKSKAKEAFLLGEKDLMDLPSAAYESKTLAGKDCISTLLLMSDVKEAAFAKYGGADGLAAEFARCMSAAVERYAKSQSTAKPQKKRPKIEKMSSRPADDVRKLMFFGASLPLGIAFREKERRAYPSTIGSPLKMDNSVTCNRCGKMGLWSDVIMHERLEHGIDMHQLHPQPWSWADGLSMLEDVPGVTQELLQLFSTASITYTCTANAHDDQDFPGNQSRSIVLLCSRSQSPPRETRATISRSASTCTVV
jgi:hypothetical protein